jgi:hypothetical protein
MIKSSFFQKILFCLLFLPAVGLLPGQAGAEQKMILRQDANLRTGPGTDSQVIQALLKDTMVIKKEAAQSWFKVYCPTIKQTGWINAGLLRAVKQTPKKEPEPTPYNKKVTIAAPQKSFTPLPRKAPNLISAADHKLPPISIAVIDLQQVIEKSRKGRAARQNFENLQKENSGQNSAQTEQQLLAPIIMEIHLLVEIYAQENKLTHVLNKNSGALFHYDERFDITRKIIQLYDRQYTEKP